MPTEKETFIQENRERCERGISMEQERIAEYLEEIASMATKALNRLNNEGTANVVDSNVNGIGNAYDQMIQSIERMNTLKQMITYCFTCNTTN